MHPKHSHTFQIKGTRFRVTAREDGRLQVTSIHPYDETEYHWALQVTKSRWHIFREGRLVTTILEHSEINSEQIAHCLLRADLEAKLIPWRAVW